MIPFIMTFDGNGNTITMVIKNKPYTINPDHINYWEILEELKGSQDVDVVTKLLDIKQAIKTYFGNSSEWLEFDLSNSVIKYKGEEIHTTLVNKILMMMKMGFDVEPMVNFMRNLYDNPSQRAIDELYSFIEYGKLPITPDGCFLAYKRVRDDYKSVHDGITDNSIGVTVSMPREHVNDDSSQTCSTGLHLCSFEYLSEFSGDRIVILKVNPRDIVSIPNDYNNTKARACEYQVIGEVTDELNKSNKPVLPEVVAQTSLFDEYVTQNAREILQDVINTYRSSLDNIPNTRPSRSDYVALKPEQDVEQPDQSIIDMYTNDVIQIKIQPGTNTQEEYSEMFRAAYNVGYTAGKKRHPQDTDDVLAGDYVTIADEYDYVLTQQDADDINAGYDIGYKHGKSHKKRLVKQFDYTDIQVF